MGYWYTINVKFANKEESIKDVLIAKGLAEEKVDNRGKVFLEVNLNEVLSEEDKAKIKITDALFPFNLKEDGSLEYFSKWSPRFVSTEALSLCFKDEVIEVTFSGESWNDVGHFYLKDCELSMKDSANCLFYIGIPPKMVRENRDGSWRVSLPIGEEDNKWGYLTLPAQNVFVMHSQYVEITEPVRAMVYFDTEEEKVYFRTKGEVAISTEDIVRLYLESKKNYKEDMNRVVYAYNVLPENVTRRPGVDGMNDYYIVKLPAPNGVSENGILKVTRMESQVLFNEANNTYTVDIGLYGGTINVRRFQNNNWEQELIPVKDLYKKCKEELGEEVCIEQTQVQEQEEEEESDFDETVPFN
jgi:hypothetical protein